MGNVLKCSKDNEPLLNLALDLLRNLQDIIDVMVIVKKGLKRDLSMLPFNTELQEELSKIRSLLITARIIFNNIKRLCKRIDDNASVKMLNNYVLELDHYNDEIDLLVVNVNKLSSIRI